MSSYEETKDRAREREAWATRKGQDIGDPPRRPGDDWDQPDHDYDDWDDDDQD